MPLYEYECDACGHVFERIQKFSDSLVKVCPKCGKKTVHKLLSSPAIKFKGSGFYINDYAKKGASGSEADKAAATAKADAKDKSADAKGKSSPDSSSKAAPSSGSADTVSADSSSKSKDS